MKNYLRLILVTCYCSVQMSACHSQTNQLDIKSIVHYNVVIVPDLSNRLLRSKNIPDAAIVNMIVQNIYPKIARHKRTINQNDRYRVILTSKKLGSIHHSDFSKLKIDLGEFKSNQKERIDYLTGRNQEHNLQSDGAGFVAEFTRTEASARLKTDGADIWSFFNSGIDRDLIATNELPKTFNNQLFRNEYKNIIVLFTDGYIEAGITGSQGCEGKQCRYLSAETIKKFRSAYRSRTDKKESLEIFFHRNNYGITAAANPYLKNFDVLLLEADDRSLTKTGNATVVPTDFEIMDLFWRDWMKKSGVQRFEIYPVARDASEAQTNLFSFMGIK